MAQPLPYTRPIRDPRAELHQRLNDAPDDHAEAILSAFEILQGLHDRGLLEIARGMLGSSEKVLEIAVDFASTPQTIRSLRNLILLVNLIGEIDPGQLKSITSSVPVALNAASTTKPPGFWKLALIALWNRDFRRGLWLSMSLLTAIGRRDAITHAEQKSNS